jgi:hypothetical protein
MSTISETSPIPGFNTGILVPKMPNRFRVIFTNSKSDADLNVLSQQIISINPPEKIFGKEHYGQIMGGNLYFEYEDDILSKAASAVNELGTFQLKFNMAIELLDGNGKVIEQITFKECKVFSHAHVNNLDYAASASPKETKVKFNTKTLVGNLIEEIPGSEKLLGLLEKFFQELDISINSGVPAANGKVTRGVYVMFEDRKDVYPKC